MSPRKDDVRWHTFTTEQHKEAKALVGAMKEGEGEIEQIVEELEKFVVDCGWGDEEEEEGNAVES